MHVAIVASAATKLQNDKEIFGDVVHFAMVAAHEINFQLGREHAGNTDADYKSMRS